MSGRPDPLFRGLEDVVIDVKMWAYRSDPRQAVRLLTRIHESDVLRDSAQTLGVIGTICNGTRGIRSPQMVRMVAEMQRNEPRRNDVIAFPAHGEDGAA
jgi:hypothetical protein